MKKLTSSLWTLLIIVALFLVVGLSGLTPSSVKAQAPPVTEDDDPDLPRIAQGRIDKEEYLRLREEHVNRLRGWPYEKRDARVRAIQEMERQELFDKKRDARVSLQKTESQELANALTISTTAWTPIGPAPIPNGQTSPQTSVSGRVSAIAVHPNNTGIVYVGAAQGGVYRSTDGGTTWLAIFDSAQSLAIGAIAIAPSDPTTVFVGTGEAAFSGDSFFGVGVYRISNADTMPVLEGPFNLDSSSVDVMTGRSISRIVVHPTDSNTIFVSTTSGVAGIGRQIQPSPAPPRGLFRSTNALAVTPRFTKLSVANNADRNIFDVVMDPGDPNVLVCAVYGLNTGLPCGISCTDDGGIHRSANALAANPTFTRTLAIGTNTAGFRTELAINKVGAVVTVFAAIGEPSDSVTCNNAGQLGTLKKSTDGGQTWSGAIAAADGFCGGQCFYNISLALDPFDANNLVLGGQGNNTCSRMVKRSTDGGTSFTSASSGVHADNQAAVFSSAITFPAPPGSIAYMGTDGGIYKSGNGGASWTSLNNAGFNATQFQGLALHPTDREFMFGGTQDNGTEFKRPDGTWTRADSGDGGFALIDHNATDTTNVTIYHTYSNRTGSIIGFGRVDTSACATDGGWAFRGVFSGTPDPTPRCDGTPGQISNGIGLNDPVQFYAPMALGPGSPNTVYFGTDRLYRSTDKGDSMTVVSQGPLEAGSPVPTLTAIGISPQNDHVRIVGLSNGHVYATTAGASTLTNVTGPIPAKYVGRAVIDPTNDSTAYVTLSAYGLAAGGHVWKTTNLNAFPGAPTWNAAGIGIPDVPVNAFVVNPANPNHLYAGTDIGVYRSTDGGASWTPFSNGLPRVAVFDMAIQPTFKVLRIANHGRGIWEISLLGTQEPPHVSTVGLYDPSGAAFSLRNTNTGGPADVTFTYGGAGLGFIAIAGDWNGDGVDTIGLYDPATATFFLRNSNTGGVADVSFTYGPAGLGFIPLAGDWDGDGVATIGLYDPVNAAFFLRNSNTGGIADVIFTYGPGGLGYRPLAGDWNGDGVDTIGLYDPANAAFFLRNSNTGGIADLSFTYGPAGLGFIAIVGDWNADGVDTIGLYYPPGAGFFLRNSNTGGIADVLFNFGPAGSGLMPIVGDWNGQ